MYDKMLFIRMLIKSLKSGNHYQFITLFVVCATGRSCLLFNNIVPFDNKDSAKKKHRQIYRFIKVLCDRAEVPAVRGEYILQSNVFFCNSSPLYCFVKLRNMAGERSMLGSVSVIGGIFRHIH